MTEAEEIEAKRDEGLRALAEVARPPYADAYENLVVLHDALVERGAIEPPVSHFHDELTQALEASTARAHEKGLRRAFHWGGAQPDKEPNEDRYGTLSYERSCKRAKDKGLVVKHPQPNELFLDVDTREQIETFERNVEVLRRWVGVKSVVRTASPSDRPYRFHYVVTMHHPVTAFERIALQAALGSDPMREMLSLMRIYQNNPHYCLFFEHPPGAERKAPPRSSNEYWGG
jgi:hypothetical protein